MLVALIFSASTVIGQTTAKSSSNINESQNRAVTSSDVNIGNRQNSRGANFVDSNQDGVCDNYSTSGTRRGPNYIDSNKDGVCDHRNGQRIGNGHRNRSMGKGAINNQWNNRKRGNRSNYVDNNQNGQCDNAEVKSNEPISK